MRHTTPKQTRFFSILDRAIDQHLFLSPILWLLLAHVQISAPLAAPTTQRASTSHASHAPPTTSSLGSQDHTLDHQRISRLQPEHWVEWLHDMGGVWLHQRHVATAGWSLRGGFGGQIALRFDGVPLLSALQTLDPSRQPLTIDPRIIGSLSLIRGPSSFRLGNHAFAGAIKLRSIKAPSTFDRKPFRFSGRLRASYQSADQSPEGHGVIGFSGRGGGLLLAGGGALHQPLTTGGDTGKVHQSDYLRAHAMGRFHWRWHTTELTALYLFGQADNSKYTALFFPQSDVSRYRERRHLAYLSLKQDVGQGHIRLLLAYQHLDSYENTQDIALGTRKIEASREQARPRHLTSASLAGKHPLHKSLSLEYQLEWIWERLRTEQLSQTGAQRLLPQRIPVSGDRHSIAVAAGLALSLLQRHKTQLSMRLGGRFHPHWDALQPPLPVLGRDAPIDRAFATLHLPWALEAAIQLTDRRKLWSLQLAYQTGYRVPSWQAQAGAGPQGESFWRPNAQLQPEYNHSLEATFRLQWKRRIRWEIRTFGQLWQQMIGLRRANYQGSGQVGALEVIQHTNHDELIPSIGTESVFWVRLWRGWSAKASIAWLYLFDRALTTTPLHIWPSTAPLSGRLATRYQFGRWGGIEAALSIAAAQTTRHSPKPLQLLLNQKNPTYAAWTKVTLRANLRITRHLQLIANLDNLSHQTYLRFGSLVYAPGIHYRFQLVGQW